MTTTRATTTVLFDLDGTLTDPREGFVASVRHALLQLGRSAPSDSELACHIGPPLEDTLALLLGSTNDRGEVEAAVALYRQRYAAEGILENCVYPGIPSALTKLQALGMSLYVATSKPLVFAERILEHFGLRKFFRVVYGSELDGTRSNKRDLIAYILDREKMSPHSTHMVGDRARDIVGAKANAVRSIGALWGYGSREELTAAGATALCEQPSLLSEVLSFNCALQPIAGSGG